MNEQVINYASKKAELCKNNDNISPRLYDEYGVKKGLRDENGKGVLAGLTNISKIISSKIIDGKKVSCEGELWYRGYKVEDLINSLGPNELGFEKVTYLLLMGELPSGEELSSFKEVIGSLRTLPSNFTRDVIMKAPSSDIMNTITRSVLTLASYDKNALDTSVNNSLRQCIQLISEFPLIAIYAYHAFTYYEKQDKHLAHCLLHRT